MTFRVQRSVTDDEVVLMLSGDIAPDRAAERQAILDTDAGL
jgi:hypothetical protein